MKNTLIAVALFAAFSAHAGRAVDITVAYSGNSVYDYVPASYQTIPFSGQVKLSFDVDAISRQIDYGQTSIVEYYGIPEFYSIPFSSSLTTSIPDYVFGVLGNNPSRYVFPYTDDYASTFIEQFAVQSNSYISGYPDGENYSYHLEFRVDRQSIPRNGDGSSDYFFTADQTLDFLQNSMLNQTPVYFNESFGVYKFENGVPIYSDGKSWSDYNARITSVTVSPIPEPSTYLMALTGLVALGIRKKFKSFGV